MSKLAALVKATALNERKYSPSAFVRVSADVCPAEDTAYMNYMTTYRIGVEVGAKCYIPDHGKSDIDQRISAMRKAVIEEVFGEFRAPIHALRHAVYDRDFIKAMAALDRLEDQMFSEEK